MRRVHVIHRVSYPSGKGVVLRDEESLEDFIEKLRRDTFPDLKIRSLRSAESNVEIADANFIRDNDTVIIDCAGDKFHDDWVTLNVGGEIITTCRSTLVSRCPGSALSKMFSNLEGGMASSLRDRNGAYMIDRSPEYLKPIVNYLRTGRLIMNPGISPEGVLEEALYFGIEEIISELRTLISENVSRDTKPLSRRDVIDALLITSSNTELRFQGVDFTGADLSKLDLRNINFRYANLTHCHLVGANLSDCCLERADLSGAVMDGAQMKRVKMLRANLEGVSLKGANFEDPLGKYANMEGVNLRNAILEGSCMRGVNLRVATVKNGNMKNCDLREACLAGADLEFCDLSGSDLHEANLRGANLKDTILELMVTPLHMSQAIR